MSEEILATLIMLVFMLGVVRLVFGRFPWVIARERNMAKRIYRIEPDPEHPVAAVSFTSSLETLGKAHKSHYIIFSDNEKVGSFVMSYEPAEYKITSRLVTTELVLGNRSYLFSDKDLNANGTVIVQYSTVLQQEYVLSRNSMLRYSASLAFKGSDYKFNTGMYFREFSWTDQSGIKILSAQLKFGIKTNAEIYSKTILPEDDEILLCVLGFHGVVSEQSTYVKM